MVDEQLILDSVGPVQAILDAHDGVVNVVDTTDGIIMISLERLYWIVLLNDCDAPLLFSDET